MLPLDDIALGELRSRDEVLDGVLRRAAVLRRRRQALRSLPVIAITVVLSLVAVGSASNQSVKTDAPPVVGQPDQNESPATDPRGLGSSPSASTGASDTATTSGGEAAPVGSKSPSDTPGGTDGGFTTTTAHDVTVLRERPLRVDEDAGEVWIRYDSTCGKVADGSGAGIGDYVEYRTEDGTARAGTDYTSASGKLNHYGGYVQLRVISDAEVEGDETVRIIFTYQGVGTCDHPFEVEEILTITDADD